MLPSEPEGTFKVVDRRRRSSDDDAAPPPAAPETDGQLDLTGLFVMLANAAIGALDDEPRQAVELVEILHLLRRKTEGRRTASETRTLDEVLAELQLRFAEATKQTG